MLKYKDIIDRLSEKQKISLLADVSRLCDLEYKAAGIPCVNMGDIQEFLMKYYPSSSSLANSFDSDLIKEVASDVYKRMDREGINLVNVPSAKQKINPCRYALSEDPYAAARMSGAFIEAAKNENMSVILPDLSIRDDEADFLDKVPDKRFLHECMAEPHLYAASFGKPIGAFVDGGSLNSSYKKANEGFASFIRKNEGDKTFGFVLRRNIHKEDTVLHIKNGDICCDGSETVIKTALNKYEKLSRAIQNGRSTVDELENEVARGNALSSDDMDAACDRIIELAHLCNRGSNAGVGVSDKNIDLIYRSVYASTVLLENKGKILPYSVKRKKVALIGDIISHYGDRSSDAQKFTDRLTEMGVKKCEYARGYDINTYKRDTNLQSEAIDAVKGADIVFVFVGTDKKREKHITRSEHIVLPANQIELLDMLQEFGKKVVVVMSSNYELEADFGKCFAGFLMAPLNTEDCVFAVMNILTGAASPLGKLSSSLYDDTKTLLLKGRAYKNIWNMKVGSFLGYKLYDSEGDPPPYEFGYGLGYGNIKYQGCHFSHSQVTVNLINMGKHKDSELVCLYLGMENSKLIRPKKVLVDYKKVTLDPLGHTHVTFDLKALPVYNEKNGKMESESGTYVLYIASSPSDIKYTKRMHMGNSVFESDMARECDYLQSKTNILDDKYTLEADHKLMKKEIRNIIFGIGSLVLSITLFVFTGVSGVRATVLIGVAAALAIAAMAFLGLEFYDRKKRHDEERKMIDAANEELFEDADRMDIFMAEKMFVDEFDTSDAVVEENREVSYVQGEEGDYLAHINKELTFADACEDLELLAGENGYKLSKDTIREIFAAISSSRIIVLNGADDEQYKNIMMLLCEYFDCPMYSDTVDASYVNEESMLFKISDDGQRSKKNILKGIESAYEEKYGIRLLSLTNVKLSDLTRYFVSFTRFARNPSSAPSIDARNENDNEISYVIPQNVWMVLNLANGESVADLPEFMADITTVISVEYTKCPAQEIHGNVRKFEYHQLDYLIEKCKNKYEFSEEVWKKFDKLEEYINLHHPVHFGNKMWTGVEKYSSSFIACGGDMDMAVDRVLASKLLPSVVIAINKGQNKEAKGLGETLDTIFGEENTSVTRSTLASYNTDIV